MTFKNIIFIVVCSAIIFGSCRKPESEIVGCMDEFSLTYDPRATVDDGSCSYHDLNYKLWTDGLPGVWGTTETTEDMAFNSCKGNVDTVVYQNSTDSSLVMFFGRDTLSGYSVMTLSTINPVDGLEFKGGFMRFEALLPTNSTISTFFVKMSGTVTTNLDNCGTRYLSQGINVSTDVLNDTSFVSVQLPLIDFYKKDYVNIQEIMSIECFETDTASNDTLLMVRNIQWFSN
jgi:hypothetical protein